MEWMNIHLILLFLLDTLAVNDAENFAENFAHYVIYSNEFRDKIVTDPLLIEEYEFMRDVIFSGFEF